MKLMNPVFYERTKDGEVFYDIHSRLIKDRVIFLSEDITSELAGTVSSLLFMLNHENSEEKIQLWINSNGGDIYALLTIYDMMQLIKAPVETTCIGTAFSAAALLVAAGEKGKRLATPNSIFMVHQAIGGTGYGKISDIAINLDHAKSLNNSVHKILAQHTGRNLEQVFKDCKEDKYMTAQEALEYGIIDKIIPAKKVMPKLITEKRLKKKVTTK